jgi:hypothetical protein
MQNYVKVNSQKHRFSSFFTVLFVSLIICSGLSAQENNGSDLQYAVQILQMLCGLPSEDVSADADISGDNKIGMEEAVKALQAAAGIHSKYEMRFGITGGMYPAIEEGTEAIQAVTAELDQMGMIWLRHPGDDTDWFEIQPERDQWNFGKLDAVINGNDHPCIIGLYGEKGAVYPLGNFSEDILNSLSSQNDITDYLKTHTVDMSDPDQKADAEIYVREMVKRYKDSVKYWEIGNEGISDEGMFDIVKNTYEWVKAEDPDAVVLLTSVAGSSSGMFYSDLEALDSLLAQGAGEYFDAGNFHYYGNVEGGFEESLEKVFDDYKMTLEKYGLEKPIWVTETSTSSHGSSILSGTSSLQTQARHVLKRLVIFSAKGAEKVFWHDYKDTSSDSLFYQCNLADPDTDTPKPAYYTFKLLVDKLGYYRSVEALRRDDVRLYKFVSELGKPVYVGWSEEYQLIDLSQYTDKGEVLVTQIIETDDSTAESRTITADNVELTQSPVFIE